MGGGIEDPEVQGHPQVLTDFRNNWNSIILWDLKDFFLWGRVVSVTTKPGRVRILMKQKGNLGCGGAHFNPNTWDAEAGR